MQAVTAEEQALDVGTTSSVNKKDRFHFAPEDSKQPLFEQIATGVILVATCAWLVIFATCKVAAMAAPWCIVLSAVSVFAFVQIMKSPRQESLSLLSFGGESPTSLRQTIALSYAVFSLSMCIWMVVHKDFEFKQPVTTTRQVIDIELVSDKDFKDNNDILPGTVEKETVKARSASAEVSAQAPQPLLLHKAPSAPAAVRVARTPSESTNKATATKPAKVDSTPDIFPMRISEAPRSTPIPVKAQSQPAKPAAEQPMLEEVAPTEMVEMTENTGDKGTETFQAGGRSKGGTGTPAPISAYLKELHRRIKHAWTPPSGVTRSAEVLFRIRHNGSLISVKLVHSSGDESIDESALQAISECAPFKALPENFAPQFLDLQYKFNYTADSLSELNNRQTY